MGNRDIQIFRSLLSKSDLPKIKESINSCKNELSSQNDEEISFRVNGSIKHIKIGYLIRELEQILKTRTIKRTYYYINRLIKSISESKSSKINDLNLNRWKEYNDLVTDSLWIMERRDQSGAHNADYWGNFIPQIPNQFLRRYTKKGEWVLDPFAGSGTTLIECKRLERNGIGIELNPETVKLAIRNLKKEKSNNACLTKIVREDSTKIDFKSILSSVGSSSVQFVFLHPPYWNIIKFSNKKTDLSNAKSVDSFLDMLGSVVDNCLPVLDDNRYLVLIIGDKYSDGEWIPLGFYAMQELMKRGLKLKSTIVKNFDATKGKINQKELWRYRALAGGFYIFKHEYIFLFKKEKRKKNV